MRPGRITELGAEHIFNWGQINFNLVNRRGIKPKGAERFLVPQYEEAPLGFIPLRLEINVDLTPIKKKPSTEGGLECSTGKVPGSLQISRWRKCQRLWFP